MTNPTPHHDPPTDIDSPRKRVKLSSPPSTTSTSTPSIPPQLPPPTSPVANPIAKMDEPEVPMPMAENGFQPERELQCAILHFVNPSNPGFTGVLKQRYTDFIVNEIALDGTVIHLISDKPPKFKSVIKDNTASNPSSTQELSTTTVVPAPGNDNKDSSTDAVQQDSVSSHPTLPNPNDSAITATPAASMEEPLGDGHVQLFTLHPKDEEALVKYFDVPLKDELVKFQRQILAKPQAKPATFGSLFSSPITDRVLRGRIHQDIRRIFNSRIETLLVEDGTSIIKFSAALPIKPHPEGYSRRNQQRPKTNMPKGKLGWQELGGEYLHFSVYKENKNTLEVTSFMGRKLNIKPREFGFAGTKDRRAATTQRISVRRQYADRVSAVAREMWNGKIGDFKYEKHGLELGDLQGNEFTITLRDCHFGNDSNLDEEGRVHFANDVVGRAVEHLKSHGFINYFGLQRFGSFDIGTDDVGKKILMEDYKGAVWAILAFKEETLAAEPNPDARGKDRIASDYIYRARAINNFKTTGKYQALPTTFSAEQSLIRHLSSTHKGNDYLGALMTITRNMRSLYPHAYQSLVWNAVASERWSRYGNKVIEGDLVIIDTGAEKAKAKDEVDDSGEVVIHPAEDDIGLSYDDVYQRARPLTAEEAASGKYSMFDIVLPTPGFDVEYPNNDIGEFYKEFMGSERGGGLDPANMRRSQKDFSLSGSYRKLLAQVGDLTFEVRTYRDETEQFVDTDLDKLMKAKQAHQHQNPTQDIRGAQNGRGRGRRYDNNAALRGGRSSSGFFNQHQGGYQQHRSNDARLHGNGDIRHHYTDIRQNGSGDIRQHDNDIQHAPSTTVAAPADATPANATPADATPTDATPADATPAEPAPAQAATDLAVPDQAILAQATSSIHPNLAAWQNLPAKLAAEDEAAAAYELERRNTPVNPDAIKQPIYRETFVETSLVNNEGQRTGHRSTKLIGADGKEVTEEEADKINKENANTDLKAAVGQADNSNAARLHSLALSMDGVADELFVPEAEGPAKIAVIIKFSLGPSMYATMALRELMKAGGVKTYKPEFSTGD